MRSDLRVPQHATVDLSGQQVLEHDTHGKHLLTRFSGGVTLHTHLRMDGSWTVTGPGKQLPRRVHPDVRVGILSLARVREFGDPAQLFFNVNAPADLERAEAMWQQRA